MYDRTRICEGTGYHVSYSVRDNTVYEGTGYHVAYTIRGEHICEGTGYHISYTIRDEHVCESTGIIYATRYEVTIFVRERATMYHTL